jgi:hypothetical protein
MPDFTTADRFGRQTNLLATARIYYPSPVNAAITPSTRQ